MLAGSVCVTYDEFEGAREIVVVSVEFVGPYCMFVEGDMMSNKYWFGLVNSFQWQRFVELFVDNLLVIK